MKKGIIISLFIIILMICGVIYCKNLRIEAIHDIHTHKTIFTNRDSIEIDIMNVTQDIKTINIVKLKECGLGEIYSEEEWLEFLKKCDENYILEEYNRAKRNLENYIERKKILEKSISEEEIQAYINFEKAELQQIKKSIENTEKEIESLKKSKSRVITFSEEVTPFIYDYETTEINENYDHSEYFVEAEVSYQYKFDYNNIHSSIGKYTIGPEKFESEEAIIDFFQKEFDVDREYIKNNYTCERTIYYKCYKIEEYQNFNNFNIKNNIITILFKEPENSAGGLEEAWTSYAINIVAKDGKIITNIIYDPSSPLGYNAERMQYDYEKCELDFIYPTKTIFQNINNFISRYVEIFISIFLILVMISLKVFVSKLFKMNITKKLIISHIFLQPLYQIIAIFVDVLINGEVGSSLIYYILIVFLNSIFSVVEILIYLKIIKNESKRKLIIYTLITNIIPLLYVYISVISLMYSW